MKKVLAVLSLNNDYSEAISKLNAVSEEILFEITYIENLSLSKLNNMHYYDAIYIVNNNDLTRQFLPVLNHKTKFLINKTYWFENFSKVTAQQNLKINNILAPSIIYPLPTDYIEEYFIKSISHTVGVIHPKDAKKNFNKCNKLQYYLEEQVITGKEEKIYVVNNECSLNNLPYNDFSKDIERISTILGLNVFSADVFIDNDSINIVDVNPASCFFKDDYARHKFIDYLKIMLY